VTPSAAYASEAEPPLLHITTLTTAYATAVCDSCVSMHRVTVT